MFINMDISDKTGLACQVLIACLLLENGKSAGDIECQWNCFPVYYTDTMSICQEIGVV